MLTRKQLLEEAGIKQPSEATIAGPTPLFHGLLRREDAVAQGFTIADGDTECAYKGSIFAPVECALLLTEREEALVLAVLQVIDSNPLAGKKCQAILEASYPETLSWDFL